MSSELLLFIILIVNEMFVCFLIQMKSERPMRVTANLICAESDQEYTDYVFSHVMGSVITFIVNMVNPGFYKLQLYATPMCDKSEKLLGVYNYLINCKKITQNVMKFPKQYAQWKVSGKVMGMKAGLMDCCLVVPLPS